MVHLLFYTDPLRAKELFTRNDSFPWFLPDRSDLLSDCDSPAKMNVERGSKSHQAGTLWSTEKK